MKNRCPWLKGNNPEYIQYHDREWGRPVHDDRLLFEYLILEGAQAGLSWETVLMKRERYRQVFHNFEPSRVARMTAKDVTRLMQDAGIIRNRRKLESTISNAKSLLAVQREFGSFATYLWQWVDGKPIINSFSSLRDYPSKTKVSDAIAKDLKLRGFRFVGSTIIYAYMQAVGLTQDHATGCYLHGKKLRALF